MWKRLGLPAIWRSKPNLLTLTDIVIRDSLIHCAYQLKMATRNHHAPAWDVLQEPADLVSPFVFGYLNDAEKALLTACEACNRAICACRENAGSEVIRIATGQRLTIMLISPDPSVCQSFTLENLAGFTGLCRRYRSPEEVERLLHGVFAKVAHG
ncbi:hypothetical protein PWG14_28050 [Chromobacterium amazonense]|uniref:hypothetical protein n=1 Tax=Chromobacterium amazonense TaxID=1382803 RepID=UPI0005839490|nr:hypothetical protein [Chromobacterium amazonense]KIA79775.1 hypothetical protein QR66_14185 [Chromobacterium piscinae]MDE1716324.1 hypothetical protein [Chromobacterium amazonense]